MKNVLIVEDSKAIRSMIRVSLEEDGNFFAVEAGNGFEALKTLPTRRFDLVITDINMPDINGLELIGFVKSNPEYKERGMALGASGFVVKPFTKKDLMSMVSSVLGGK
jgi:two-component system chemotaxis response regulator CheY